MLAFSKAATVLVLFLAPLGAEEAIPAREKRKVTEPEIVKAAEVRGLDFLVLFY
jgi:hypothetical protein